MPKEAVLRPARIAETAPRADPLETPQDIRVGQGVSQKGLEGAPCYCKGGANEGGKEYPGQPHGEDDKPFWPRRCTGIRCTLHEDP